MALTLDCSTTNIIGLSDYLDYISAKVDFRDVDQILDTGTMLKALSNNRSFLVEKINEELLSWRDFQLGNVATAQTLVLGGGKEFYVRANMWMPPESVSGPSKWETDLFAYNLPHDHNFSFMTVGYFGPGYATSIYEYDPDEVDGFPGEHVKLRFLEKTTLPVGKVMFYREGRDVHSQDHPEKFSISLNLMLKTKNHLSNQYWFNLEKGMIADYVKHQDAEGRLALCKLAGIAGNHTTMNILESIASCHEAPRVRGAAYESLAILSKGDEQAVWTRASQDNHVFVRSLARNSMEKSALPK